MTSPTSATTQRAARENSPPSRRLPWSARLFTQLSRRGLPPPVCGVRVAPGMEVPAADGVPLLEGREPVDGHAVAYVCEHFVCQAPVTSPEALAAAL